MATATAEKANGKGKPVAGKNGIAGFVLDKVDAGVMHAWIDEFGGGFPFDGTPADAPPATVGMAIFNWLHKAHPGVEMVECDVCDGLSPESLEACPYCGSAGAPPELAGTVDAAPVAEPPAPPHDETSAGPKKAKGEKKKKKKPGAAKVEGGAAAAAEESIEMETQMNGKATKGTNGITHVKGEGPALATGKATVKTLDRLVEEAKALRDSSMRDYVGFGAKLAEIHDKRLWQLRLGDTNKAKYASFDAFIVHEFGVTPQYATNLMKHGREFSPEERAQLGRSKMTLILQAPPAERAALKKETAEKKLSKRQLEKRVKASREKAGYTGETRQQQAAAQSAKKKAKKDTASAAPAPKVTAVLLDGKKTIKMYQRPASIRNIKLEDCKRVKRIADRPFTIIELGNQGRLLVEVKADPKGELQLTYEFQRAE